MTDLFNLLDISSKANPIDYALVLDCSLRRKQQSHNIKCLNERSKRSLSTFLFDWWFAGV